jgi:hypothetical protein
MSDDIIRLLAVALLAIGGASAARWAYDTANPLPRPGEVCWDGVTSTAAGRTKEHHCEPLQGWHMARVPEVGTVPLPDYVDVVVRRPGYQDYENWQVRRTGTSGPTRPPTVDRWR